MYRIVRGVPRYGIDLRERDLPQETGQEHALNFSKGCYIGQEIVERIRARGNVHRTFIGFEVEGEPPQPGTKVRANEKDMGEITSATRLPNGHIVAVGYLRREVAGPGTAFKLASRAPQCTTCLSSFDGIKTYARKKRRNLNLSSPIAASSAPTANCARTL